MGPISLNLLSNQSIDKAYGNLVLQLCHKMIQCDLINCSVSLKALNSNSYIKFIVFVIFTFHSSDEGQRLTARWCGTQNVLTYNNITLIQRWF